MYNLPHTKDKDAATIIDFMRQYPFAMVIGVDSDNRPVATQIPMLLKERADGWYLEGHMLKGTDHYRAFENNQETLVVFTGPHAFVNASWYETRHKASTWNYMTVQAKGLLSMVSYDRLQQMLDEVTAHFDTDPDSPSQYKALPAEYIHSVSKAIVGFEIKITSLDHVFKLSQNRDEKSYGNIIERLKQTDADGQAIAHEMEKRKDQLFPG